MTKPRDPKSRDGFRHVIPDHDYLADLETAEGEAAMRKRMKMRDRGKRVPPLREPT